MNQLRRLIACEILSPSNARAVSGVRTPLGSTSDHMNALRAEASDVASPESIRDLAWQFVLRTATLYICVQKRFE